MLKTVRSTFVMLLFFFSLNANASHPDFLLKGRMGFLDLKKSIKTGKQGTAPTQKITKGEAGEIAFTKFITSHTAVELGGGFSFIRTKGRSDTKTRNSNLIPLNAFLQFHFPIKGSFVPYVGAGYTYHIIQHTSNKYKIKKAGNLGYQAGIDLFLTNNVGVNLDCKYASIKHKISDDSEEFNSKLKTLFIMTGVVISF